MAQEAVHFESRFDRLVSGEFDAGLSYDFWPAEEAGSKKLLIVLHGRGDSVEGFHWLPEALKIDAFNYLFLNAPDIYGTGFSWYELPPRQAPGIVRSRRLLNTLLNRLTGEFGLAPSDIFLFGFSQGCLMCFDVALRYPKALGGIVAVSGYVYFLEEYPEAFSKAFSHQRILSTHGTRDSMLPIHATRVSVAKLRQLGANIDWREYDKEHTIDEQVELPEIQAFLMRLLEIC